MQISVFSSLSLLAIATTSFLGTVAAKPVTSPTTSDLPTDSSGEAFLLGPAPYDVLKAQVEAGGLRKRAELGGVYMCEDINFGGQCIYGQYALGNNHHPNDYWRTRTSSVGPDNGIHDNDNCGNLGGFTQIWYRYPGGNLFGAVHDNLRCFWCRRA
ncbi:hypothetical protein BDZ91DRAFT_767126 [Kalaharituber pfeilii]|nr:hypothetical protein BDZ91DRAFT_767126 [Kalaharituber pfeilii]